METTSIRAARGRVSRLRGAVAVALLASSSLAAIPAAAAVRVEAGVSRFDAAGDFDSDTDGLDLRAAWMLRGPYELEVGVIEQRGDWRVPFLAGTTPSHDWRALHAGVRGTWPLSPRWSLSAALALAHVDDERATPVFGADDGDGDTFPLPIGSSVSSHSTLGGLASLGVAFRIGERQSLRLDLRRLHAGVGQRCELEQLGPDQSYVDCAHVGYRSVDGLSLSWGWTFD